MSKPKKIENDWEVKLKKYRSEMESMLDAGATVGSVFKEYKINSRFQKDFNARYKEEYGYTLLDYKRRIRGKEIKKQKELAQVKKKRQDQQKKAAGDLWDDLGFPDLVSTYPNGKHYSQSNVHKFFQNILKKAGLEHHRFHDLRHIYAVSSLRAGDDVKTVQENMGHFTAAFTLDKYAHVTETMRRDSANRMQAFYEAL